MSEGTATGHPLALIIYGQELSTGHITPVIAQTVKNPWFFLKNRAQRHK
jgi:hypothetical protein